VRPQRFFLLAAAALLLAATACGERGEPTGSSDALYPVTVSSNDTPLVVSRPARRIAVIAPELAGLVGALGAGSHLVGTPVTKNGAVHLQTLRELKPDLVLASLSSNDPRQVARAGAAARAKMYVASDTSVQGVERSITQLGLLTDTSVTARKLIDRIRSQRSLVARKLRGVAPVKVFVDLGFFTTPSEQSLIGDVVRLAGGRNVAASAAGGAFDLAKLARLNPAVYLAMSDSGTTLADLRKNRRTRKLAAVRDKHFVIVDRSLLQPGARIGDGLVTIARALHPDAFR
jgi:ABC-type Fe3+-hydroxamate transport system substrate-binding protein